MSETTDLKAKQEFLTMISHSLEILEVDDGMLSKTNRQSIRNGILETISELMDQRDTANARAEKAEARANGALKKAVSAIYFDDNSDYGTALWSIIRQLGGEELASRLETDKQAVFDQVCKKGGGE